MSTAETTQDANASPVTQEAAAAAASGPVQHTATLVRGRVYFLGKKEFEVGKPVVVTEQEKAYLEANAFDLVSVEGEGEHQARAKFEFATSGAAADTPKPARNRGRA
jgi:hypothetical protein